MHAFAASFRFVYLVGPWIERKLEPTIMVVSCPGIGGIIFAEVFRRFVLKEQAPWSTTLPPFLFLIMTWFGCSYNVKLRTHLAFSEFRTAMPRAGQMACLMLAVVLWIGGDEKEISEKRISEMLVVRGFGPMAIVFVAGMVLESLPVTIILAPIVHSVGAAICTAVLRRPCSKRTPPTPSPNPPPCWKNCARSVNAAIRWTAKSS